MIFNSDKHKETYELWCSYMNHADSYTQSLLYTLASNQVTREHIDEIFSFQESRIYEEALDAEWQTGGSYKTTTLAYNLWNDFLDSENPWDCTPSELFRHEDALYFMEAIKLRYPEYCRTTEERQSDVQKYLLHKEMNKESVR